VHRQQTSQYKEAIKTNEKTKNTSIKCCDSQVLIHNRTSSVVKSTAGDILPLHTTSTIKCCVSSKIADADLCETIEIM